MGGFWGPERLFWRTHGVYSTAAGYAGGHVSHPSYEDVCSGMTGTHRGGSRGVRSRRDIRRKTYSRCSGRTTIQLRGRWRDTALVINIGRPYFYPDSAQHKAAVASKLLYQRALSDTGQGIIVTEIAPPVEFFYAESYHQQYLRK
jgi:peptide-methionine (S)-S-oxide reductase